MKKGFFQSKQNFYLAWILFLLTASLSLQAGAHPLDLGILVLEQKNGALEVKLEVNPNIGLKLLHFPLDTQESDRASIFLAHEKEFFDLTLGSSQLVIQHQVCVWQDHPQINLESPLVLSIVVKIICPQNQGELRFDLPFLKKLDPSYNLIGKIRLGSVERVLGADPANPFIRLTIANQEPHFFQFVEMGLQHIGLMPREWQSSQGWHLPYGIDHILFVLALLLVGENLISLLKMVTGFTVGHTLSLSLAAFHIFQVPSLWIEPVIALTIALVAAESLFNFRVAKEWKVSFLIGLIHGLGFATALNDLHLATGGLVQAILGFNLGVELGQVCIILLFFYFIFWLKARPFGRNYILRFSSFVILVLSLYWFGQRGFSLWQSF